MLPWAIAVTRGKANAGAIGILNFFVGWTLIGWVLALVWAMNDRPRFVYKYVPPPYNR